MSEFDLTMSYAKDHELADLTETVDWIPDNTGVADADRRLSITGAKVRPADLTDRRTQEVAANLGLTSDQTLYQFWPNSDAACEVRPRDFLKREENAYGEVINTCLRSPFGYWLLACTKETRNVAVTT